MALQRRFIPFTCSSGTLLPEAIYSPPTEWRSYSVVRHVVTGLVRHCVTESGYYGLWWILVGMLLRYDALFGRRLHKESMTRRRSAFHVTTMGQSSILTASKYETMLIGGR